MKYTEQQAEIMKLALIDLTQSLDTSIARRARSALWEAGIISGDGTDGIRECRRLWQKQARLLGKPDITNMTSAEVNALIFKDAHPAKLVSMPLWVAEQVAECDHFDRNLQDWAINTLDGADIWGAVNASA